MNRLITYTIAVLSQLLCVLCSSTEIYYPGTFDPFHNTHLHEVTKAAELFEHSQIYICPIETAYYNTLPNGTRRPLLIPYETTIALLSETFAAHKSIKPSRALRHIDVHIFESLKKLACESQDPDLYLLIGTDILSIWKNLPHFDSVRDRFKFLVSRDARNPSLTSQLEKEFALDPNFTFITADVIGIRSTQLINALFEGTSVADELTPKVFASFLLGNVALLSQFWQQCLNFAYNLASIELGVSMPEVKELVHTYIFGVTDAAVPKALRDKFETIMQEKSSWLRSTLELYKRWYQGAWLA